ILCFDASFQNTGNATLNVDVLGAITLYRNGAEIPAGTIEKDQKVLVTYDGTNFEVLSVTRAITTYTDPISTRGDIIRGDSSGDVERLAVGNADEILGTDGTDAAWRAITSYVAAQADLEGATAVTAYTSPGRQEFHPSAAKVWVEFAVDGTLGNSFNVASVDDDGVGNFGINLSTAFSGTGYSVVLSGDTSANTQILLWVETRNTGSIEIQLHDTGGTDNEGSVTDVMLTAFGDQ
ncbi:hypothetical protein LCGC14_2573520, partial [marine sediment metagenome]